MKKTIITIAKFSLFLTLSILPFISITQLLGIDAFLDSFENPDYYLVLENQGYISGSTIQKNDLVIIQKSTHPTFDIQKNDYIVYFSNNDILNCNKVSSIEILGANKFYSFYDEADNNRIYEKQVLGKIINSIDNNIWNSITTKLWDISINKLNLKALISD